MAALLALSVALIAARGKDVSVTVSETLPGSPARVRDAIKAQFPAEYSWKGELPLLRARASNRYSARVELELIAGAEDETTVRLTATQYNSEEVLRDWAGAMLSKARERLASRPDDGPSRLGDASSAKPVEQTARRAASDIGEPPQIEAPPRKAHAVVIGIERYRERLPKADFAAADAKLVSKYLTRVLGYPAQNVAVLIGESATKGDFEKYFERWLPNRVERDDEVFVFFSGHGAPNPRTGDAYLVPYDGDPTYLEQTGYPLSGLYERLGKLSAKNVTVVLDSCFSGAGGRSVLANGAKPLVNVVAAPVIPAKLSVLTASAGDQISYAYGEKGHGLFTYFLLKGLSRQAAKGPVSIRAAFDFASPNVSRVARQDYNSDQVPEWKGPQPPDR